MRRSCRVPPLSKEGFQMFAMTRLRLLGALVISSALAALIALVAFSSDAQANHSWGNYHWARTSNPFNLPLGDNVTLAWGSYLGTTATDWSPQACWTRRSSPVKPAEAIAVR